MKKIIVIIIVILLLILGVTFYVSSFKTDQEETKKLMSEVNEDYDKFNKNMTAFVNKRNEFYKQKDSIFLEDISKDTSVWTNFMNDYEKVIENVDESGKRLKKACKNNFGDITVKTKCNQFRVNYESANNYYITDVKVYNNIVDKYNEWASSNYQNLEKVKLKIYDDYIDYDEDGEYFGKEGSK